MALNQLGVLSLILDFGIFTVDHILFSSKKYFAFFKMTIFDLMYKFGLQGKAGHNNLLNCLFQNANWGRAETSWRRKSLNVPHFFSEKSFKLQRIDKTILKFVFGDSIKTALVINFISETVAFHWSCSFLAVQDSSIGDLDSQ